MIESYLIATLGQRRDGRAGREMRNSEPLCDLQSGAGPAVEFVAFCWKYIEYISRSTHIGVYGGGAPE